MTYYDHATLMAWQLAAWASPSTEPNRNSAQREQAEDTVREDSFTKCGHGPLQSKRTKSSDTTARAAVPPGAMFHKCRNAPPPTQHYDRFDDTA